MTTCCMIGRMGVGEIWARSGLCDAHTIGSLAIKGIVLEFVESSSTNLDSARGAHLKFRESKNVSDVVISVQSNCEIGRRHDNSSAGNNLAMERGNAAFK